MNKRAMINFAITFIIASWVMYRLAIDAKTTIKAGWDTTLVSQEFQTIKLILLVGTGLFFMRRLFEIIPQINKASN